MRDGRASRTAYRVALRRAAHQLFDAPRVLEDPLALRIVGEAAVAEIRADPARQGGAAARSLRAFMAVRSRFAEDELAAAVDRGVRHYVVLGAGLDTSAYRGVALASGLRIFEVDHPATQAWKRQCLAAADIPVPGAVTFAAVDFESQTLAAELSKAGFHAAPAFFSWLGVTPYLTREAFDATIAFVAALPAPTGIVFDYAVDPAALNLPDRIALRALRRRVAAAGEPFRLFFEPRGLERALRAAGFDALEDLGTDEINLRYFGGRGDGLRLRGRAGRLMSARRTAPAPSAAAPY